MSDQNSRQLAHDNLNTLAEIMMSAIDESCCELDKSNAVQVEAESTTIVKRRRGRPPRVQGNNGGVAVQQSKKNNKADDEDVCFICFDGGSLVLCDRRGCPKAYHPACIKRDEAFFQSKAQWNCGWHLCNTCQKASYYLCYTCPYSLCKRCTKGADYVSVRGSKGFCGICLRTIMLIEHPAQGSQETIRVDFDDKGSWEYLFKVYWVNLKGELSLTVDELTRAKNPWKGDEAMPKKLVSSGLQAVNPKRRKIDSQPKLLNGEMTINIDKTLRDRVAYQRGNGDLNQADPASAILQNLGKQLMATSEPSSALLWTTRIGNSEMDRIWHYQDPSGKVQGPFSMSQLRKWSTSGHFPADLRIWKLGERQDSSVLLTDVLHGQYNKKLPPSYSSITHSQDMNSTTSNGVIYSVGQPSSFNGVQKDSTNVNKSQQPIQYVIGLKCNSHHEPVRSYQGPSRDMILTSKNGDNNLAEGNNFSTEDVQKESQTSVINQNSKTSNVGSKGIDHEDRVRNSGSESQSSSRSAVTDVVSVSEQQGQGGSSSQGWVSKGGNDYSPSQPQVFSPDRSGKCTPSVQLEGPGNENFQPGQIDLNGCPFNTPESQINSGHSIEKQSDSEDYSSQSTEQSRRPPYMVSPLEVWDTKFASAANLCKTSEKNDQVGASSLSNTATPPTSENLNDQGIGSRQPVSSIYIQDSGPNWSTTSSQECGVEQRKEITGEWSRCSQTLSRPSDDLGCALVSGSTLRPSDIVGDHAATSTSGSDQGRHSSESHQASNPSAWQEILPDPNEFCCLVDESVSDLLAEVEAMESLNANGPGTPTSIMNCGGDLAEGSIEDCFSPGGSFSHMGIFGTSDPRKTDDLSITGDTQLTSQPTVADKPNIGHQTNVLDPSKRFDGQFSHSIEVDIDARNSDVSVTQLELFGVHLSPPSIRDCNTSNPNTSWRLPGLEAMGSKRGSVQENANLSWLNLLKATEPLFVEPEREPHTGTS